MESLKERLKPRYWQVNGWGLSVVQGIFTGYSSKTLIFQRDLVDCEISGFPRRL